MNERSDQNMFWLGDDDSPVRLSADQILIGLESGAFTADTPIRIQHDAESRPLARYVRELVWLSHREQAPNESRADNRTLFETAFEGAPFGVVLSDLAGIVIQSNQAFRTMLGYTSVELRGMRVGQLSDETSREDEIRLGNELLSGKIQQFEIEKSFINKAGQAVPTYTAITLARAEDGSPRYVIAHVMDLTERRQLEHRQRLAEAESRAKTSFLSSMSHEFRTPLNAIIGYTQLLQREQGFTAAQQSYLQTIDRSSKHLLELVNAVLDMAMIEAGNDTFDSGLFNLHELLLSIMKMLRPVAVKKGLEFRLGSLHNAPACIVSDATKLRQILMNLIGNALKYTQKGAVTVDVHRLKSRSQNTTLCFRVHDTGCGIPSDQIANIFSPFRRVNPESSELGAGLGLSVSRRFARVLGGDISLESDEHSGSTFTLTIPVVEQPNACPDDSIGDLRQVLSGTTECHIVIVDDVDENLVMLQKMLEGVGFRVSAFLSAQEALNAVTLELPDLVLSDLKMPQMNGIELMHAIRNLPNGAALPIAIITASVLGSERSLAMKNGANAVIDKPFLEQDLFAAIASMIDVEFEPIVRREQAISTPPAKESLPAEIVERLLGAAQTGEFFLIDGLLKTLAETAPTASSEIEEALLAYDYDAIERMLTEDR